MGDRRALQVCRNGAVHFLSRLLSMLRSAVSSGQMPWDSAVGLFCMNSQPASKQQWRVIGGAAQAGTSHDLGDNFAKAFGTQFLNEAGDLVHPQQSSWGASTRLIGGIIMTHGALMLHVSHSCHAKG